MKYYMTQKSWLLKKQGIPKKWWIIKNYCYEENENKDVKSVTCIYYHFHLILSILFLKISLFYSYVLVMIQHPQIQSHCTNKKFKKYHINDTSCNISFIINRSWIFYLCNLTYFPVLYFYSVFAFPFLIYYISKRSTARLLRMSMQNSINYVRISLDNFWENFKLPYLHMVQ